MERKDYKVHQLQSDSFLQRSTNDAPVFVPLAVYYELCLYLMLLLMEIPRVLGMQKANLSHFLTKFSISTHSVLVWCLVRMKGNNYASGNSTGHYDGALHERGRHAVVSQL